MPSDDPDIDIINAQTKGTSEKRLPDGKGKGQPAQRGTAKVLKRNSIGLPI